MAVLQKAKGKKHPERLYEKLLSRDDWAHHPNSGNTFTETETNIALLIVLAVILMLFWLPLAEIFR